MPEALKISVFIFGAILVLIAIIGGNFKLFGAEVAATVSNPILRFVAFSIGAFLLVVAIHSEMPGVSSPPSEKTTPIVASPSSSTLIPAPTLPPEVFQPKTLAPSSKQLKTVASQDIKDYWELKVNVNRDTLNPGKVMRKFELLAFFEQKGDELSGKLVAANSTACKEAVISGKVQGDKVYWEISFTGSCCQGARMSFDGVILPTRIISGKMKPIGEPPANCHLWWADVTMIERQS